MIFEKYRRLPLFVWNALLLAVLSAIAAPGCDLTNSTSKSKTAQSRPKVDHIGQLEVQDADGAIKKIQDYAEGKNLVVVVSRGYFGSVCQFCCAQTQTLASNYSKIVDVGGKVVVVFPIEKAIDKSFSGELVDAARIVMKSPTAELPFPVVYDEQLLAVDKLGIRGHLAKPATYIIDRDGKLRFSYVGADPADRPRISTILDQLRSIK